MRVCFWSTTFQSDNHALAAFLASRGDEITVALPRADVFLREPINQIVPLAARFLERDSPQTEALLRSERFDVVVVDNHLPSYKVGDRMFVLWHGLGWRVDDLRLMRSELKRLVGDVTRTNPNFRWHASSEWDREYRICHSQLAEENVVTLGSPFSDWLRRGGRFDESFDKRSVQHAYSLNFDRPVVLVALTWHHGGSLRHWGDEETLLGRLVQHIEARGASTLLRMHDRGRYTAAYLDVVAKVAAQAGDSLMLKWKDSSPDSLLDIAVSDVCISNYSSLLNHFYSTERPSIHIDPHDHDAPAQVSYQMFMKVPIQRSVASREELWKLPPEEHGGLRATSFDELIEQVDRALADPGCCRAQSREFLRTYGASLAGHSCERTAAFLDGWVGTAPAERKHHEPVAASVGR